MNFLFKKAHNDTSYAMVLPEANNIQAILNSKFMFSCSPKFTPQYSGGN